MVTTSEYAPGRAVDLYGPADAPVVLLWHGMQTDSRAAVAPLAERIAQRGLAVVAPDWNSHADDNGRADLLESARFAAGHAGGSGGLIVVGWSMGGAAATGLTFGASEYGVPIARTVCLAGAFMARDPLTGRPLAPPPPAGGQRVPITLVHGTTDDVVRVDTSRDYTADMGAAGWRVQYIELAADHGNIVGARYDAEADRYEPSDDPASLAVADEVARIVATH